MNETQPLSVNELNLLIKDSLESQFFYCVVEGEISNVAFPQSGHVYFSLKDDYSTIRAVAWRNTAVQFLHLLKNGTKVGVHAKLTVYPPQGEYQLIINRVEPFGIGKLFAEFEVLKKKLITEGLFDAVHKKAIPLHPQMIGIITSETAAALHDVLNVLMTHRPDIPVKIYPSLVQGDGAAQSIAEAIKLANKENKVDVLLLVRGGGSIEDLWSFNDEKVARAIYESKIPIISGVGHETDTTIADYVADVRAATPSVAARLSSVSMNEIFQLLDGREEKLYYLVQNKIGLYRSKVQLINDGLYKNDPKLRTYTAQIHLEKLLQNLYSFSQRKLTIVERALSELKGRLRIALLEKQTVAYHHELKQLSYRLSSNLDKKFEKYQKMIGENALQLEQLSPLGVLSRGYSLVVLEREQRGIRRISEVEIGDLLEVRLQDGSLKAEVKTINYDKNVKISDI